MSSNKKKKFPLIPFIIVTTVIVVAVIKVIIPLFISLTYKKSKAEVDSNKSIDSYLIQEVETVIKNKNIRGNIISSLDKSKVDVLQTSSLQQASTMNAKNKVSYSANICVGGSDCDKTIDDYRLGLIVMWGKFRQYLKTPNSSVMQSITEDINKYAQDSIQADQYTCKVIYEMWSSSVFSTDVKNNLKKICQEVSFDPIRSSEEEIDDEYLAFRFSSHASDNVYRYLMTQDQSTLAKARQYFEIARKFYAYRGNLQKMNYKTFLAIAALDLYKVTNEQDYLKIPNEAIEQLNSQPSCTFTMECVGKMLLADEAQNYSVLSSFNNLVSLKAKVSQYLINNAYDENAKAFKTMGTINGKAEYITMDNAFINAILNK